MSTVILHIFLAISILTSAPNTQQANISVQVKNLTTGKILEEERADHIVPPASVMKLLTTGCALETLGADFRFTTTLSYSGTIENGVLRGNIYIKGEGDPSLGDRKVKGRGQNFLPGWVRAIQKAGIRRIEGGIVADLSTFDADATNPAWLWEDCGNYYAPGIFAINYMGNTLHITLKSGPIGNNADILGTDPQIPDLRFINHIRCTQITEDGAFVHGLPYSHERYLVGSIPSNRGTFGVKSDIPNPGLLLARHLTQQLNAAGIECMEAASFEAEHCTGARTLIHEHKSEPLSELLKETNMNSNNLYAEAIFRYLGLQYGTPGTINNSCHVVQDFWMRRGVQLGGALIKDGCGLAPQDAVSAEQFVQMLQYMSKSKQWDAWYASLPVSGVSGTLKSLCDGTELEGKIHAKSGTISGTKNFAGYIDMPNGDQLAFAILISSGKGKARHIQTVIEKYLVDLYHAYR